MSAPSARVRPLAAAPRVRPRLCLVGQLLGRNPGYITTQGEKLADLFADAGYPIVSTSS